MFWVSVTKIQRKVVSIADPSGCLRTYDGKMSQQAGLLGLIKEVQGLIKEKYCASVCPLMAMSFPWQKGIESLGLD